ncbi:unnamed protein product [Mesocestoides corti]|uniref:Usp domain-containing protein n=1 Tax=Mesocestoides corti TaxID=53468 RepID=A0A0R3UCR6_MESCO|nr:unnamed protein product [Mesocestoides corti]
MASESNVDRVVLLPVDGSAHCERAFKWYIKRIMKPGDKLVLLHIVQPHYITPPGGFAMDQAAVDISSNVNEGIAAGKKILERYSQMCKAAHCPHVISLHIDSSVGNTVIKVAEEHKASLIVIASRGIGKARRTILGGVSHYVILHSGVPVLVVPAAKRSSASFVSEVESLENE